MKTILLGTCAALAAVVNGDIYLHNPRGSNGRGCRNSNDPNRSGNEAQRLFDSQNNDKGGYSCGQAYPFDCYTETSEEDRQACNAKNTELSDEEAKAQVNEDGTLKHPDAINTPKMYFYTGSILPVEWTVQHGSGINAKVHSDMIVQVACEEDEPGIFSFTDDCGTGDKVCHPRDGTPINNQDNVNTERIPDEPAAQDNYRYGRHESYRYYEFCKKLERNKGLFTADQDLNSNSATATRQNPNSNRNGFECPEESEYFPYWQPSPWIDVAIITSDPEKCERDRLESQNVKDKFYCECEDCDGRGELPNNERHCIEKGGKWVAFPAWNKRYQGVSAPSCITGAFSRDNHLGNVAGLGQASFYNWTIPDFLGGRNKCVLRVRYNISTSDFNELSVLGDSRFNDVQSPLVDRNENPAGVFKSLSNLCEGSNCKLGLAINTNQYGRTFQDRSHMFQIRPKPATPKCDNIYNLNVRGKRGNIVQAYPAVEYDFVPNVLVATEDDCIHVQWTGSDYNPNRNPNNAEGGPPNPNNINEGKTDRSNMVQLAHERENIMLSDASQFTMFKVNVSTYRRLAFLDQEIDNAQKCYSYEVLRELNDNNNDATDRDHRNCFKLSGQKTPYFDAGLLKPRKGVHKYMSTRNNNFSNRGQKGTLIIEDSPTLAGGTVAGIVIGAIAGAAALLAFAAFCIIPRRKRRAASTAVKSVPRSGPASPGTSLQKPTPPASSSLAAPLSGTSAPPSSFTVTALYAHASKEPGELAFKPGDKITVLHQDSSGWWEGRHSNGSVGIFPSNYVTTEKDVQLAVSAV